MISIKKKHLLQRLLLLVRPRATSFVKDHNASVYLKLQGDALQVGGYEVDPIFIEKVL